MLPQNKNNWNGSCTIEITLIPSHFLTITPIQSLIRIQLKTSKTNFTRWDISLDWHDDKSRACLQRPGQGQEGVHHGQGVDEAHQEIIKTGTNELDVKGKFKATYKGRYHIMGSNNVQTSWGWAGPSSAHTGIALYFIFLIWYN